ncbi:hypothetical protein [Bosea sp. 47.2.35]|uniref:hypothetical protein n=1 Tax=Bosea sp. 47.2.35 TaxID=2969304 RepID=UPI00214FFD7D|nr:hypothetical protein [Bosea sp. 47.2.35]MCR4521683.1 hypothetical protein [Bosea sp. 47.2.35]
MPYGHIYELDGVAYDYAKHLIEGLISNEEHFGPGTYASWGSDFGLIREAVGNGFYEVDGDALQVVMTRREWKQVREGVLAALAQLQAEEAEAVAEAA